MKVLIVNRYMSVYGGAEQVVKELSSRLTKRNIENAVVTLNISDAVRALAPDIRYITPPVSFAYEFRSASLISALGIFNEIKYLRRMVLEHYRGFDLINIHNFPANWVVSGLGKPVVWMCNEVPDFYANPRLSVLLRAVRTAGVTVDRYLVNRSIDTICAADDLNAGTIKERYGRDSAIVPYGIDFPLDVALFRDKKAVLFSRYGLTDEDFILLQVGVLSPAKNQKTSIDALAGVLSAIPRAKLILAGNDDSPYARELKNYIKANSLESRVVFTGQLTKDEVYRLYSICNLGLFPVKLQGGYLAVFEAIAFGLPVIVSPLMGAAALVRRYDLGIVSNDFTASINAVFAAYVSYQVKAGQAALWVKDNLTWDIFTQKMIDIFDNSLNNRRQDEQ